MVKSKFNKNLAQFKDIHQGKSAIIFATGPTIKQYTPLQDSEDYIKVGLNRIYDYPQILKNLDYYYYGSHYYIDGDHKNKIDDICNSFKFTTLASAYEEGQSHKIIGRGNVTPERALELGSIPFENNLREFSCNIAEYSTLGHSIVFPPLQHVLYMGVNKIYLVGCDGGFTSGVHSGNNELLYWWTKFTEFKNQYYPQTEIISVNPVSLKGWFQDEFTR